MKKSGVIISATVFCLLATFSCQVSWLPSDASKRTIRAKVKSSDPSTKTSAETQETLLRTIDLGGCGLQMQEYESDFLSQPFMGGNVRTKAKVVTSDSFSTDYSEFGVEGFLDNYQEIDYASVPILEDHYIISGTAKYSSTDKDWTLLNSEGKEYNWLNKIRYTFWAYAPKTSSGTFSYEKVGSRGTMTITDYQNPAMSADQKDLLVSCTKRTYDSTNNSQYVDMNFRHALSHVHFDFSGVNEDYTVTKVSIIGAFSEADCTVKGTDLDADDVTKAFAWSPDEAKTATFELSTATDGFFMIPQTLPSDAKIRLTVMKEESETYIEIPFSATWKAGKTYKYIMSYSGVLDVEVSETFTGSVKQNVGAKNSGSATGFIRAAVIANWVNDAGKCISPCDFTTEKKALENYLGTGWTLHTDGYYYYGKAVAGGKNTSNIFTKYEPVEGSGTLHMVVIVQSIAYDKGCAKAKAAWGNDIPIIDAIE